MPLSFAPGHLLLGGHLFISVRRSHAFKAVLSTIFELLLSSFEDVRSFFFSVYRKSLPSRTNRKRARGIPFYRPELPYPPLTRTLSRECLGRIDQGFFSLTIFFESPFYLRLVTTVSTCFGFDRDFSVCVFSFPRRRTSPVPLVASRPRRLLFWRFAHCAGPVQITDPAFSLSLSTRPGSLSSPFFFLEEERSDFCSFLLAKGKVPFFFRESGRLFRSTFNRQGDLLSLFLL